MVLVAVLCSELGLETNWACSMGAGDVEDDMVVVQVQRMHQVVAGDDFISRSTTDSASCR